LFHAAASYRLPAVTARPRRPLLIATVCAMALSGAALAAPTGPAPATAAQREPVVWVQPGHLPPLEPGYRAQTGAGTGPFGSELGFTRRLAAAVIRDLRSDGVDARRTPGLVRPFGARGAVFISLHHGAPGDHAGVGYAVTGGGENYYHGEGFGTASQRPYPDSAPHRRATRVSEPVARRSRALAADLARAFGSIHTAADGARGADDGVVPAGGNLRMTHYYGFYRTNADARVILECGPAGADDAFLRHVDLIARTVAGSVVEYLRGRGLAR
jgi:hypothetical protein